MKTKIFLSLLLLITMVYSVSAQTNKQASADSCEALVITAFPQLLLGGNITPFETQLVLTLAKNDGIILDNGKVEKKEELANLVFILMKQPELALHFGSKPPDRAQLVGYILEMSNRREKHYVLTGLDKNKILYNPCNATGSVASALEVYVYTK